MDHGIPYLREWDNRVLGEGEAGMRFSTAFSRSVRLFLHKPATLQGCMSACDDVGSECLGIYFWVGLGEGNDKCVGLSDLGTAVVQSPPKISQSLRKLPTRPPTPTPTTAAPTTSAPTPPPTKVLDSPSGDHNLQLMVSPTQQMVYEVVHDNLALSPDERGKSFSTAFARKHRLFMRKYTSVEGCLDECDSAGNCLGVFFWYGTGEGNTKCVGLDNLGEAAEQDSALQSLSLRRVGSLQLASTETPAAARVEEFAPTTALDLDVFAAKLEVAGSTFLLEFEGQTGRVARTAQRQFSTSFKASAYLFSNQMDLYECAAACSRHSSCLGFAVFYGLQEAEPISSLCVGLNDLGDPAGDDTTLLAFSYIKV